MLDIDLPDATGLPQALRKARDLYADRAETAFTQNPHYTRPLPSQLAAIADVLEVAAERIEDIFRRYKR